MRRVDDAITAPWDIAVPPRSPIPGIDMAGFTARSGTLIDLRVIPHPAVTLFIDLGDGLVVDDQSGRQTRGAGVIGLAPAARLRGLARDLDCLQVRLSPVVAHTVLDASAELGGAVVDLEDLWGRDAVRLREQLHEQRSWTDRFSITQAALGRRLARGHEVDPEVERSWECLRAVHGRIRVEHLAADAQWSRRRLWSRFRSQIGITPKRAAQLIRFDHAAHRLAAGQLPAAVAADSGYADQSHLHRDTAAITGLTPSALATAAWLSVDDVAWAAAPGRWCRTRR